MKLQAILCGVAGIALASAVTVAGQVDLNKMAKLRNPAGLTEQAPGDYKVNFDTSSGAFVMQVHEDWAPLARRPLLQPGEERLLRRCAVLPGRCRTSWSQFGMHGNPAITKAWSGTSLKDEPTKQTNKRGYITFARTGAPNSRGTQVFINYRDNALPRQAGLRAVR